MDRERARLGVDGLPDRRHAAADGRPRSARSPTAASTSSRASCARCTATAVRYAGDAESRPARHQRRHRGGADDDHGRGRRPTAPRSARGIDGYTDRRQDRHGAEADRRPATRIPITTRRSSASCRRATRRSRSSSSSTRRTGPNGDHGGTVAAPIFKTHRGTGAAVSRDRRRASTRRRRCSSPAASSPARRRPPPSAASAPGRQPDRRRTARDRARPARPERARSGPKARHARAERARRRRRLRRVADHRSRARRSTPTPSAVSCFERSPPRPGAGGTPMTWAELHGVASRARSHPR